MVGNSPEVLGFGRPRFAGVLGYLALLLAETPGTGQGPMALC